MLCVVVHFSDNPENLRHLASLPVGSQLWVQIGQQDELAEAELKFKGPLSRGSSAVLFGVELKVSFIQGIGIFKYDHMNLGFLIPSFELCCMSVILWKIFVGIV